MIQNENIFKKTIVIKDNKLTDELREKCKNMFEKVKSMDTKERLKYYPEIDALLREVIDNKNQNYYDCIKEGINQKNIFFEIQYESITDKETEEIINGLFDILTEKID